MNIILGLPPETKPDDWVGIDVEIFNMNQEQMHRPTNGDFALMSIAIGDDVYLIRDEGDVSKALQLVKRSWWGLHNAKFDLTHLRRWGSVPERRKVWDTLIMDKILWGGYYDTFALDDLVRRYLHTHMEKELQKSFVGSEISESQLAYAASDAWVLPKIMEKQKEHLSGKEFKVWDVVDRPAMFSFMDFRGFAIDVDRWQRLALENKRKAEVIEEQLPFNPRSNGKNGQVVTWMRENGFKGIGDNKAATLEKFILKYPETDAARAAQLVLDCKTYGKRSSTYGMNFIENYLEYDDGIPMIYCNYWVVGAETGRTSSDKPNMQNIPVRDTSEFRECFIARPHHKLLVADYSQQEVYIAAYISQDERLMEICNSGQDIYIMMAKLMYGLDIDKTNPLRKRMKAIVLGTNYGMSAYGLALKEGISKEEAEEVLEKFRRTFPQMARWMSEQASSSSYVETVSGRRYYLNPFSRQSERNALNAPIQGSAGDSTKLALANTHRNWPFDCPYGAVGYIHDELVFDVPERICEDAAIFIKETMIESANSMFPGMSFRAEVDMGDNWACKH